MKSKTALLEKLNRATDRATNLAIQRGLPITISKRSSLVGNLCVEKNKDGYYDVLASNKEILYENLSSFDVAVIIAQRIMSREYSVIKQVLTLEKDYSKHHSDMVNYLNCMKSAATKKDYIRIHILEDKFQISELKAKSTKDSLAQFKRQE
jgi:hypothetical protein